MVAKLALVVAGASLLPIAQYVSPFLPTPPILDSRDMGGATVPSGPCAIHQSFIGSDRSHWRCNSSATWFQMLGANMPFGPATTTTMGGIKVGANLSVQPDGTLSATSAIAGPAGADSTVPGPQGPTGPPGASQPAYTLPAATATVLGGVKVGANIAVQPDGTISVASPYTSTQAAAAAPVQSVAGRTGAVTLSTSDVSGLGTAAQQPAGAFYPATGNPSGFLTSAPITATTQPIGDATTKLATDQFVQTAIAAIPPCPAASATVAGCSTQAFAATGKATVSGTLSATSLLGAGFLPPMTLTVPGASLGDGAVVAFAGVPPAGLTISGTAIRAAGTVEITPAATGALSLSAQAVSFNVYRSR